MGSESVVKELVEHGAEVNGTNAVIIHACSSAYVIVTT